MMRFVRTASSAVDDIRRAVEDLEEYSLEEAAVRSCWQRSPGVSWRYVVYRCLIFVIHLAIFDMSFLEIGRNFNPDFTVGINAPRTIKFYMKWGLYLTHWGLVFNAVQSFLGALLVLNAFRFQRAGSSAPSFFRTIANLYHVLFVVSVNLSIFIAAGFWSWVYDPADSNIDALTLSEHGMCTFLLIVDLFIVGLPYKLFYGFYTTTVTLVYMCMTYVHHLCGALDRFQDHTFLYEKNDWDYPR
ncbi:unnamed protein product, partial [Nesidiocoris tenuis]